MASDYRVLNGLTVETSAGAQARFTHYAGSPEGNVVAPIGSLCTDNTTGKVYKKVTGVSNTGWAELSGAEALQIFDWKTPVLAVVTSNINLATVGLADIDGVTPQDGDRIGVVGQNTASQNGIYIAHTTAWTRASDADANAEGNAGLAFAVVRGTIYKGSVWVLTTAGVVDVDSTALEFTQVNPVYSAATNGGIAVVNHQISVQGFLRGSGALTASTLAVLDTAAYEALVWRVFAKTTDGTSSYSATIHAAASKEVVDYSVSGILRIGTLTLTISVAQVGTALELTVTPSATGTYVVTREVVSLSAPETTPN